MPSQAQRQMDTVVGSFNANHYEDEHVLGT